MKKLTTEEFVARAKDVHGCNYDHSETVYINSKTKIKAKHVKCGLTFERTPSNHLKGHGCKYCANQFLNTELFIAKSKTVHGDGRYNYDCSEYTTAKKKVKIKCSDCNNFFYQTASDHIQGYGCSYCGGTKKKGFSEFLASAHKKHGLKFKYNESTFESLSKKIPIECCECGSIFNQSPKKHLAGDGCPNCRSTKMGWSKTNFLRFCEKNNGSAILYLLSCSNDFEDFFKVGITSNSIKTRYASKRLMPYDYKVIGEVKLEGSTVWGLEKEIIKSNKESKYKPLIDFGGSDTECFHHLNQETLSLFGVKS